MVRCFRGDWNCQPEYQLNLRELRGGAGEIGQTAAGQRSAMLCALQERKRTTRGNCQLATAKTHSRTNHFDGTSSERKRGLVQAPSFLELTPQKPESQSRLGIRPPREANLFQQR